MQVFIDERNFIYIMKAVCTEKDLTLNVETHYIY